MPDYKMTETGDLEIVNGDFALVSGDDEVIQQILFRLKTQRGDCLLSPGVGCSLEEFIGQPNTELTHAAIEQRIEDELTRDFLLGLPQVDVTDLNENEVFILIRFPSVESEYRSVQIQAQLDLRKGLVMARGLTRETPI